jgi:hypothetical protein
MLTKEQIREVARLLGQKGGRRAALNMTPEERKARAIKGSDARWAETRRIKSLADINKANQEMWERKS